MMNEMNKRLRGVSLIEMMVVVAILAVMSAVAAPQLLPITKKARLASEAESVASYLNTVRERAIAKNRCHRVLVSATGTQLSTEERNSADCATGLTLPFDNWIAAQGRLIADKGTTFSFTDPADCATCTGGAATDIVFRPSGRLRGDNDVATTDDRVRIRVIQSGLTETKNVIVMGNGRICVVHLTAAPATMLTATALTDCNLANP